MKNSDKIVCSIDRDMRSYILLEWKFTPPDYLEDMSDNPGYEYTMTIADGKVVVKVNFAIYDAHRSMRMHLDTILNNKFRAVQLHDYRDYKLSNSSFTLVYLNGRSNRFIEFEPTRLVTGSTLDFRVTDKDENVIFDSKQAQIEKKKSFEKLINKHCSDEVVDKLFQSYGSAVSDPNNELVHLYEIREALSEKFGSDHAAQTALGIHKPQWSDFGKLCNDKSLRQGRHRGKTRALRDASESELTTARGIALAMIAAYLEYLDNSL